MPSLSESQQDESARRSTRLVGRRGFYPPDDETGSTSSTGSTGQISYRESPVRVFKRKTGSRKVAGPSRTSIVSNQSQSLNVDEPYKGESFTARGSPTFRTVSAISSILTTTPMELPGSSSGYSSSEEVISTSHHTCTTSSSSAQTPSPAGFGLGDVLNSPARAFAMLYFWMGTAWYSLTSRMSLLDVSLLSRCTAGVRKAILLLLLLLLLLFGVWFLFPYRPARPPQRQTQTPVQSKSIPAFTALDPQLSELKEKLFAHLQERESKWMEDRSREMEDVLRDIALLKEDGEKHKVQYEDLKVRVRNVDSEHRALIKQEISEVKSQMSGLKSDISKLHSASEHLNQRMDAQEKHNAKLKAELSDWLLQQISGSFRSERDLVTRPELQVALEKLEKKILDRLGQERSMEKKDVWRAVGETLTQEGVGAITITDVEHIVHRALSLYRADGIGMADYALESSGASVINTRCSETYHTKTACVSLFGFPLWYPSESPRTVIQPELYPGKCWPFRGSEGFLVIGLSHPVQISHVSLEHLPRVLSPTGNINSAPKDFSVYGLLNESDVEGKLLGKFTYDQDGEPIQTFKLPGSPADVYQLVELRILSNWGHAEYTCLYRFRVHGLPQGT